MGSFKLQTPARLLFTRFLAWNARLPRLISPTVVDSRERFERRFDSAQLVSEFRGKLRQTEDLINKLGYSLRELHRRNDR